MKTFKDLKVGDAICSISVYDGSCYYDEIKSIERNNNIILKLVDDTEVFITGDNIEDIIYMSKYSDFVYFSDIAFIVNNLNGANDPPTIIQKPTKITSTDIIL